MQKPIKYLVVSVKDTNHTSLARPLSSNPEVCSPVDAFNACTQAVNKYLLDNVKTKEGQEPFLTSSEIDRFYSTIYGGLTAFCEESEMQSYLIAHRFHDINLVPHHLSLYLQKIEAVNPYIANN